MNRLEKFKQKRNLRQRYLSAAFLFFFLLTGGLLTADYATNAMFTGRPCIEIFSLISKPTYIEIVFMNQKIYVNTQYVNRDLERFKKELGLLKQ